MNQHLRDRITRKLDALPDERAYQILDFIEFLESRYAAQQNPDNVFTRFADTVEDGLRAGKISTTAIAESMNLMNKAMGVLGGVAEAGRSVASDIVATAMEAGKQVSDIAKREAGDVASREAGRPDDQRAAVHPRAAAPGVAGGPGVSGSHLAQADGTPAPLPADAERRTGNR